MKVKVKGRIRGEGTLWFRFDGKGGRDFSIHHDGFYKSKRTARSAAERLAKKLNLEIIWEG